MMLSVSFELRTGSESDCWWQRTEQGRASRQASLKSRRHRQPHSLHAPGRSGGRIGSKARSRFHIGSHRWTESTPPSSLFHIPIMWLELAALRGDRVLGERAFDALVAIDSGWNVFLNDVVIAVDSALALGIEPQRVREAFVTPMASADDAVKIEDASSYVEGLLAVGDGRHRDAIAFLEPLVGGEADERVEAIPRATTRIALVRAYLAIGDRGRALDLVRRVVEVDLGRWPGVRRDRAEEILRRLSPTRADGASRAANAADAGPGGSLTPREREVAMLLSEGLTNGQLAERLYISPKTAAVHVSNILAKLDLSGRAEIAAWAVRNMGEPASTV